MIATNSELDERLTIRVRELEKENAALDNANTRLRESNFYLQKEIDIIKSQLANQKYLDRQEVEKIIWNMVDKQNTVEWIIKDTITAICNLALKIDRDKIVEVLNNRFGEDNNIIVTSEFKKYDIVADEIISAIGGK